MFDSIFLFLKKKPINLLFGYIRVRGESHINFCTQCVIMKQTRRPPPTPFHMHNSQNFPFLILRNLIGGWREGFIKRGLVFYIKSIYLQEVVNVGESSIHQCKSWYCLRPLQTFKVGGTFWRKSFSFISSYFLVKSSNLDVSLVLKDVSNKYFLCFFSAYLSLLFQEKLRIAKRGWRG